MKNLFMLGLNIAGPVFHHKSIFPIRYDRSELHYWSLVNSVACLNLSWSSHTVRHIDGLRNSTQIIISSLVAVFDQLNEIAFFRSFICCRSPFLSIRQIWQIIFTKSVPNETFIGLGLSRAFDYQKNYSGHGS